VDELDPDAEINFRNLVTEQRLERWQAAAAASGAGFEDFVSESLDRAATAIERTSGAALNRAPLMPQTSVDAPMQPCGKCRSR
jgi:hypothetical protein